MGMAGCLELNQTTDFICRGPSRFREKKHSHPHEAIGRLASYTGFYHATRPTGWSEVCLITASLNPATAISMRATLCLLSFTPVVDLLGRRRSMVVENSINQELLE